MELTGSRWSRIAVPITIAVFLTSSLIFLRSDNLSQYASNVRNHFSNSYRPFFKDEDNVAGTALDGKCKDPYREPGYLHIPEDYRQTRWIPFTDDFLDAPAPPQAAYPPASGADVYFEPTDVPAEFKNAAPRQWMNEILAQHKRRRGTTETKEKELKPAHFTYLKDQGGFGWLWGRRVLIIGDSVDRFMVQFFCQEFGRTDQQPEPRTTATCEIPTFNLTIIQWHFSGSFTYRPDWWWMEDMKEVAFEERWDTWWSKTLDSQVRGLNGRAPDLLLWQSGLWDQRAFWEGGAAHNKTAGMGTMGEHQRQLVWEEARFVTVRLKKLLRVLRDEFGDIPSMFRTVSLHKNSNAEDANLMELDRIQRSIAEQQGHEIFEWGRILSSFTMLYRDKTHTDKGPGSWLWGNMMLEYLRRSAGSVSAWHDEEQSYFDNWALCHSRLISWGGR